MSQPAPHPSQPQPDTPDTKSVGDAPPAPKRRRRGRRLLIVFSLFVALIVLGVGLAPYWISAPPVTRTLLSFVNARLNGDIEIGGLSASWTGPIEIRELRIVDATARDVVLADRVHASGGVWNLATSLYNFGEITLNRPVVTLHVDEKGEISLADALSARAAREPAGRSDGALPRPIGTLKITDGTLRLIRPDAPAVEATDIDVDLAVKTLDDVAGKLAARVGEAGRLSGDVRFTQLVRNGGLDLRAASGQARLVSEGDIDLAALHGLAPGLPKLEGRAAIELDATAAAGTVQAETLLTLAAVKSVAAEIRQGAPVDATIRANATLTELELKATTAISGSIGDLNADATIPLAAADAIPSLDALLASLLNGEAAALPPFDVRSDGRIDLARLGQALPELLQVREDRRITAGSVHVSALQIRGGERPEIDGAVEIRDLTAEGDAGTVRIEPVALHVQAGVEPGAGLVFRKAALASGFASIEARGTLADAQADFRADLTRLRNELGQVFDLGDVELGGTLAGKLAAKRIDESNVDVTLDAQIESARYASGDVRLDLPQAAVQHSGSVSMRDGALSQYEIRQLRANVGQQLAASASGSYSPDTNAFNADLNLEQLDLGFLAARAAGLGVDALARYSGRLSGRITAQRRNADAPIFTGGTITARQLAVDGKPLTTADSTLTWADARLDPAGATLAAASLRLESALATLAAQEVQWQGGDAASLGGQVAVTADVGECLRVATLIAGGETAPTLDGRLRLDTRIAAAGSGFEVVGGGAIEQLRATGGERPVAIPPIQLAYNARMDTAARSIDLTKLQLASEALTTDVSGRIERYDTDAVFALRGRYELDWQPATALLHSIAPATANTIRLSGRSAAPFEIAGPANDGKARPAFRGLQTGLDVGWSSANLAGLSLDAARLSPTLRDGVLNVPVTAVAAADGRVNLGGELDFRGSEPVFRIPGRVRVLENVSVTPLLGEVLLSRINPIFHNITRAEGRVILNTNAIELPLGGSMSHGGAGSGTLDMRTVRIQPSGLLAELLGLLVRVDDAKMYEVRSGRCAFTLRDGRLHYDDFTLVFVDDFDLKFRGSVGFDDTLELWVSIPVREALLTRLGVRGRVTDYMEALTAARVEIPIAGTRQNPRLDLSRVDVAGLLRQATKGAIDQALGDVLRGLGGRREDPPPRGDRPPERQPERRPRRP